MSRSEYFVIAALVLTASVAAASAITPKTFVMDRVALQLSDPAVGGSRQVPDPGKQHVLFSLHCELGAHVFSIDYSSRNEE